MEMIHRKDTYDCLRTFYFILPGLIFARALVTEKNKGTEMFDNTMIRSFYEFLPHRFMEYCWLAYSPFQHFWQHL